MKAGRLAGVITVRSGAGQEFANENRSQQRVIDGRVCEFNGPPPRTVHLAPLPRPELRLVGRFRGARRRWPGAADTARGSSSGCHDLSPQAGHSAAPDRTGRGIARRDPVNNAGGANRRFAGWPLQRAFVVSAPRQLQGAAEPITRTVPVE